MGLQLIFCVEANSQCKSDYKYIKETIENFYDYNRAQIKLSTVYMDGRGNYTSRKVSDAIQKLINQYKAGNKTNRTQVIYCFDCDQYDTNQADKLFLLQAEQFCRNKGYDFVWFCRDIEHVYLGQQISSNHKKKESDIFIAKQKIKLVDERTLRHDSYKMNCSNILRVLDSYLKNAIIP